MDFLRHVASGVLSALDYLHHNNVVHRNVSSSNVYINKRGIVKLANYSLDKRLSDLGNKIHSSSYSKKSDVFKFGIFVLSIMKGTFIGDNLEIPTEFPGYTNEFPGCTREFPGNSKEFSGYSKEFPGSSFIQVSKLIPRDIPSDLYDFLEKSLCKDEKERYTPRQLLDHSFLRLPLNRFPGRKHSEDRESPVDQPVELDMMAHNTSSGKSRVQVEFQVLDCLGKGAYGEVFKVKNKLDQGYYAIKRIRLDPKATVANKKIIREVKLLSRLNHENVVRYYNSWMETIPDEEFETDVSTVSSPAPEVIQKQMSEVRAFFWNVGLQ